MFHTQRAAKQYKDNWITQVATASATATSANTAQANVPLGTISSLSANRTHLPLPKESCDDPSEAQLTGCLERLGMHLVQGQNRVAVESQAEGPLAGRHETPCHAKTKQPLQRAQRIAKMHATSSP